MVLYGFTENIVGTNSACENRPKRIFITGHADRKTPVFGTAIDSESFNCVKPLRMQDRRMQSGEANIRFQRVVYAHMTTATYGARVYFHAGCERQMYSPQRNRLSSFFVK